MALTNQQTVGLDAVATDLFHVSPGLSYACGADSVFVWLEGDGRLVELDALGARVLSTLRGRKTISEHAAHSWRRGVGGDPEAVAAAFETLVAAGILRSSGDTTAAVDAKPGPPPACDVVIVTANRPSYVRRLLLSIARQYGNGDGIGSIFVIDGSDREHDSRTVANMTSQVADATGLSIQCWDRERARAYQEHYRDVTGDYGAFRSATTPGEIGAGRNLGLLLTAGRPVVMVDDDVILTPWRSAALTDELRIVGHEDPHQWRFFETRADAVASTVAARIDLFAHHASLIGVPTGRLVRQYTGRVDMNDACPHVVTAMHGDPGARVRVTYAGLAGDSARYCPGRLLFGDGGIRRRLAADRSDFERALAYREVTRVVDCVTLSHSEVCASYFLGLDNSAALVPFAHRGRNEDGVFGSLLWASDPNTVSAYSPYGIVHDSPRESAYGSQLNVSAREIRISELLIAAIQQAAAGTMPVGQIDRMNRIGTFLDDLSRATDNSLRRSLVGASIGLRSTQLAQLEQQLNTGECPEYWRSAAECYVDDFRAASRRPEFLIPIEVQDAGGPDAAHAALRTVLRQFGQMVCEWGELWSRAKDVREAKQAV